MYIELALKSRSYILDLDCVNLSLGNFFSELFNGEFFTRFQDLPLFLSKTHTKKPKILCFA